MKFSILLPTRKRKENLNRILNSIKKTFSEENFLEVLFYIDGDDYESIKYINEINLNRKNIELKIFQDIENDKKWIGSWWEFLYQKSTGDYIMLAGDDIIFETENWDIFVLNKYKEIGHDYAVIYCNDKSPLKYELATLPFISKKWCEAVGYFIPTYFKVDFVDTWVTDIAKKCNNLYFLENVIIEHIHWCWNKTSKDDLYIEMRKRGDEFDHWNLFNLKEEERINDANKIKEKINEIQIKKVELLKINKNKTIWIFWHDLNSIPEYIKLCGESINRNKGDFDLIILSNENIKDYIDVPLTVESFIHYCQKTDFYRIKLLEKYGGIWIDYDTIILEDLSFLLNKINNDLFILGLKSNNGFIGCNYNNKMIKKASQLIDSLLIPIENKIISKENIHDSFGWGIITQIIENENDIYKFYDKNIELHYSNSISFFSDENKEIPEESFFCSLYNSTMSEHFGKMNKNDLIESNMFLSKLYKKALYKI